MRNGLFIEKANDVKSNFFQVKFQSYEVFSRKSRCLHLYIVHIPYLLLRDCSKIKPIKIAIEFMLYFCT